MKKKEAIDLLRNEGWTKADADRALQEVDFAQNPDELAIRRAASQFSGSELIRRQNLQAAQKGIVTKRNKEISSLEATLSILLSKNDALARENDRLKKDNQDLKNIVDKLRLQLAIDVKKLMKLEDSEIRQALARWFSNAQG